MMNFDVIDGWQEELDNMNAGKEGALYMYPESFVQLLGYMRTYFHLPFRQTEGVVKAHAGNKVPSIPDYSTISRRVNKLDIKVNERLGNDIIIALDSTGIKVANRGEWMRHKWNVRRRGYLKIHVAVDIRKKKVLSLQVTSEEVRDSSLMKKLVDHASENNNVKRVIADGAYDSRKNFRYLSDYGIQAAIKVRKNSSGKAMGCYPRKLVVIKQLSDLEKWKASVSYGQRWMAETVFSAIKRMFGEHVMARNYQNMVKEIFLKVSLYNMFVTMK